MTWTFSDPLGRTDRNPESLVRPFLLSETCVQTSDNRFSPLERQVTVARSVDRRRLSGGGDQPVANSVPNTQPQNFSSVINKLQHRVIFTIELLKRGPSL
jgi:hypothetical protein